MFFFSGCRTVVKNDEIALKPNTTLCDCLALRQTTTTTTKTTTTIYTYYTSFPSMNISSYHSLTGQDRDHPQSVVASSSSPTSSF